MKDIPEKARNLFDNEVFIPATKDQRLVVVVWGMQCSNLVAKQGSTTKVEGSANIRYCRIHTETPSIVAETADAVAHTVCVLPRLGDSGRFAECTRLARDIILNLRLAETRNWEYDVIG
jgi:hypothetical protein